MADQTVSGEDQRQVAISLCSTPASDWSIAAGGGASTPRSTAGVVKLVPLESMEKAMHKSKDQDDGLDDNEHNPEVPLIKKVAAEFIGTFILMFTVLSTIVADAQHGGAETLLGIAASAGLAVVAVVLAVVHVSGSHLNPAVSLAMAAFGHLPRAHVLPYAAAQTLASAAAAALARLVFRLPVPSVGAAQAFFLEMVLTFQRDGGNLDRGGDNDERTRRRVLSLLLLTDRSTDKYIYEAYVYLLFTLCASVCRPLTGPSMNPARTLGAALVTAKYKDIWVYMVAPPLGAIAGAGAYTLIKP
ncbi:hypothetical protein PR202_ga30726 [Eleusine coracana subsp. coracana]|uniref:Uncharacterized protein n=1 Tax=Eleusine coracana subsp. coracana TaxID=191504 RepID=A0AAV5DQP9_ELECO|nr:hypothetical protein PR202_ga30726 [Eleusine coracana subsp. coracana]